MDDKKIDLNKPLLSIRRQQPSSCGVSSERYGVDVKRINSSAAFSIPRLPQYKSELKSGPIGDPGTVPFVWEQTPGQPKVANKPQLQNQVGLKLPQNQVAPKLPPGRSSIAHRIDSPHVKATERKDDETAKSLFGSMRSSLNEDMKDVTKSKEMTGERKSSSSGDCEEEFVDARDTLSISGSSYLNCSMSHFTGLDDLDDNTSQGNYSTDLQAQELMERFLPAAKALASEKSKYSQRKLSSPREASQQGKQSALKPTLRYGPSFTKRYSLFGKDEVGEEEEVENEETYYQQHVCMPQGCGMLPRTLKGSLFVKPLPGSSVRMRGPFSPATRTRPHSASVHSMNQAGDIHNLLSKGISEHPKHPSNSKSRGTEEAKTSKEKVNDEVSDSGSVVGERTVYVDAVRNVETRSSFCSGSHDSGLVSRDGEEEIVVVKRMNQMDAADSPAEDIKIVACEDVETFENAEEKHILFPKQQTASDSNDSGRAPQRPPTVKKLQEKYSVLPVTPPLPKSPTDSWLFRTLPSISKNASATNRNGFKLQSHNQEFV